MSVRHVIASVDNIFFIYSCDCSIDAGVIVAEEVIVESSLHVNNPNANPQPNRRRVRNAIYYLVPDTSSASLRR